MTRFRIICLALLMVLGAEMAAACIATARAADIARQVTITYGWSGEGCVTVTEPDPVTRRSTLAERGVCGDGGSTTYLSKPGQYYGVAIHGPGQGVSCEVQIGSRTVTFEAALDYVDCLDRW